MRVDDSSNRIRGVVEAVDEFEAQGNQQCHAEQQEWHPGLHRRSGISNVLTDAVCGEQETSRQYSEEYKKGPEVHRVIKFGPGRGRLIDIVDRCGSERRHAYPQLKLYYWGI